MSRVLLAQELGMGYWHADLLARLARRFVARGHEVVAAVPDPVAAHATFGGGGGVPVLAAPHRVPPRYAFGASAAGFADILAAAGWADPAALTALAASWDALVALVAPDLIVVDHAPTLLFAQGGRRPTLHVGLGFTTPPAHLAVLPRWRVGVAPAHDAEGVLEVVRAVARARGRVVPEGLAVAMAADRVRVTALAELDPYRAERGRGEVAGALGPWPAATPWPGAGRCFAYLAGDDPRTAGVLAALAAQGLAVDAVVRDAPPGFAARLGAGVRVLAGPVALEAALGAVDLVVHHGGAGVAAAAVYAGRPQLVLPRHLEQAYNGAVLASHGVAVVVEGEEEVAAGLAVALGPAARAAAGRWAPVAHAATDPEAVERVVEAGLGLIAGR